MHSSDFFSVFEQYKERFLQQEHARENKKSLELFEKWLRGNSSLLRINTAEIRNKKIDYGNFFTGVVSEAQKILHEKGIKIKAISLGLKESSKCIIVYRDSTIYYRVGKTCPRKGNYGGMELLVMELIMDGNKNNVFIPLLQRVEAMEKRLGTRIERESPKVEGTGKYRFKLLFPFERDDSFATVRRYAKILADFIVITRQELLNLNVS